MSGITARVVMLIDLTCLSTPRRVDKIVLANTNGMVRALEASEVPLLPDNYKIDVTNRILDMCSSNSYGNLVGFDWYIDILMKLV
jgi:hypothetical protein